MPILDPASADPRLASAHALLERHFGYSALRPRQERVLRSVLAGRDTLAVLPTGAGKSVCFQIPALLAKGLTVVVSPLVALMQDQVAAANARGIAARCLNSLLPSAGQRQVLREVAAGAVQLLYVAPERGRRLGEELRAANVRVPLLAVDEAHCIAEWGPDFRPAFRRLRQLRAELGDPPCVALTGSATPAVRSDIARALGLGERGGYDLHLASFDRPNLWFAVSRVRTEKERLARLVDLLRLQDRIAIVYAPTRSLTEALARLLLERGLVARAFHAGLSRAARTRVLAEFLDDRVEVVVATCAFGLGIDKPNVRLVAHWTMPSTPEAYYQEAGRAGRDGGPARCVLLYRVGDDRLPRRQLDVTFPDRRLVERVRRDPGHGSRLPRPVAASVTRLVRELRAGSRAWSRIADRKRAAADRITAVRRYAETSRCRRAQLLAYFGERLPRCSGCDRCGAPGWPSDDRRVRARVRRLAAAVRGVASPWNGDLIDGRVVRALAENPPADPAALASVPGIGPELASRLAGPLLAAISDSEAAEGARPPVAAGTVRGNLSRWRARRAAELGVEPWQVAPDSLLDRLVERGPRTRRELAACDGVGPRFLAVEGEEVLAILGVPAAPEPGSSSLP